MKRISRIFAVVTAAVMAAVLVFGGCVSLGKKFEKPKARVHSVGIERIENAEATLLIGIEVENPNGFALRVDRLRYEAEIEGRPLTAGVLDQPAEVPAKGKSIVELPLKVKYADLIGSVIDFIGRMQRMEDKTRYRVKGTVSVGLFEIPFDEQGELKLER